MKKQVQSIIRNLSKHRYPECFAQSVIRTVFKINPDCLRSMSTGWHNAFQIPLDTSETVEKMLDEVPSEATQRERRFLYHFFSTMWKGENDVIEIGPYLGGTTRAIALGMCDNPNASSGSKLYTYDRFRCYHDPQHLIKTLNPLVMSGALNQADLDGMGGSVNFLEIFKKIHSGHDYFRCVCPIDQGVPDRPADVREAAPLFRIGEDVLADAVFVDGCKSWYGTKYFMSEVSRVSRTGSFFIFQDYGWYTCFWIPAFVETFKDYFKLLGYVDATYAFVQTKPLNRSIVEKYFPDTPKDMGEKEITVLFDALISKAKRRYDYSAVVRHSLQQAGAVAYVGNTELAKTMIKELKKDAKATQYRALINAAMRSPTYTPDGEILL